MSRVWKVDERAWNPVLTVAGILSVLLLASGCGVLGRIVSGPSLNPPPQPPTNTASSGSNTSSTFDSAKYGELISKREELAKATFPTKPNSNAVIKGKVFLATHNLEESSDYSRLEKRFADYRLAKSLDELGTLIQVNCSKGRYVATYAGKYARKVKGFAVDCNVSLVDHPNGTTVARKSFSNSNPPEVITSIEADANDEYLMPRPLGDISRYLDSLPVDKEVPPFHNLSEKELLRLPLKTELSSTPVIKGKLMIVQKWDEAVIDRSYSDTNYSGLGLSYGFTYERLTSRPEDLGTLARIVCSKGSQIGKTGNTTQFSNVCKVSLADYRTLTIIAEKTIENRTLYPNARKEDFPLEWVVGVPKEDIEAYLRTIPLG